MAFCLTGSATAQWSEDPDHPTLWSGYGINGHGVGRRAVYYFQLPANPSEFTAHVFAGAATNQTHVALDVFDAGRNALANTEAVGWTVPDERTVRFTVRRSQPLLLAVTVDRSTQDYSLWLDRRALAVTPVRIPQVSENVNSDALRNASAGRYAPAPVESATWSDGGSGTGRDQDFYYDVTAEAGEIHFTLTAQARRASTSAVTVDLDDLSGINQIRCGVIALDTPTTDRQVYRNPARRELRVHVHVDANCANYNFTITGPVVRH